MGNNLFGANISGKLAAKLGPKLKPGVLHRVKAGSRTDATAGLNSTETDHSFRGISYTRQSVIPDSSIAGTQIQKVREFVMILGDTVEGRIQPVVGDKITIDNKTTTILDVGFDPDKATYVCQVY